MLGLIGNFDFTELLVIAAVALMAFGRSLPEVAMRAAVQIARARRALMDMWREAGLEDELRRVRRDVEREANLSKLESPLKMAKDASRKYMQDVEKQIDVEAAVKAPVQASRPAEPKAPAQPTQARGAVAGPAEPPATSPGDSPGQSTLPPEDSAADEVATSSPGPDLTPRPVRRPAPADDRREDSPGGPAEPGTSSDEGRETA